MCAQDETCCDPGSDSARELVDGKAELAELTPPESRQKTVFQLPDCYLSL
jgi:hypothetical protein